jgi:hypothetical protein
MELERWPCIDADGAGENHFQIYVAFHQLAACAAVSGYWVGGLALAWHPIAQGRYQ